MASFCGRYGKCPLFPLCRVQIILQSEMENDERTDLLEILIFCQERRLKESRNSNIPNLTMLQEKSPEGLTFVSSVSNKDGNL